MMMMVVAAMMMITMIALVRHSSGGVERRELLSVRGPLGYTWGFNSFAYKLKCSIVFLFLFCASSQSSCRLYPGRSSLCVAAPNFFIFYFIFGEWKKQNKKQPLLIHIARILFLFFFGFWVRHFRIGLAPFANGGTELDRRIWYGYHVITLFVRIFPALLLSLLFHLFAPVKKKKWNEMIMKIIVFLFLLAHRKNNNSYKKKRRERLRIALLSLFKMNCYFSLVPLPVTFYFSLNLKVHHFFF